MQTHRSLQEQMSWVSAQLHQKEDQKMTTTQQPISAIHLATSDDQTQPERQSRPAKWDGKTERRAPRPNVSNLSTPGMGALNVELPPEMTRVMLGHIFRYQEALTRKEEAATRKEEMAVRKEMVQVAVQAATLVLTLLSIALSVRAIKRGLDSATEKKPI